MLFSQIKRDDKGEAPLVESTTDILSHHTTSIDNGIQSMTHSWKLDGLHTPETLLLFDRKWFQKITVKLIDKLAVKFTVSDAHHIRQIEALKTAQTSKYWNKLLQIDLLNNKL